MTAKPLKGASERATAIAALYEQAGKVKTRSGRLPSNGSPRSRRTAIAPLEAIDINQEIARERKLRNDNAEQDIALKRTTLRRLFTFLTTETVIIFLFALFQAIHWPAHFALETWSFDLLVTATIAQITGMLFVAVRYLFPTAKSPHGDVE